VASPHKPTGPVGAASSTWRIGHEGFKQISPNRFQNVIHPLWHKSIRKSITNQKRFEKNPYVVNPAVR
jgi:hypothetical protein